MDDETSRLSSWSRATEEWLPRENEKLQQKVDELSSELHALRQTLPFLENVDSTNVAETFKTLTSKCATLSDERDTLLAEQRKRDKEARAQLERDAAEIATLKRRLRSLEEQRGLYHDRCVELEKRLDNDISLYYRGGDGERREGGKRDDLQRLVDVLVSDDASAISRELQTRGFSLTRIEARRRAQPPASFTTSAAVEARPHAARPPQPPASPSPPPLSVDGISTRDVRAYVDGRPAAERSYFSRLDESASECSSYVSRDGRDGRIAGSTIKPSNRIEANETIGSSATVVAAVAENVAHHERLVVRYRESLRLVVDQLRHTADFLASRVSGGSANAEIDELVARIQAMQAELEDASNVSQRLLGESRQIGNSLARLNQTIHSSSEVEHVDAAVQSNDPETAAATLNAERNELWTRNHELLADANDREHRNYALERQRNELAERLDEALRSVDARDEELESRKRIIETLKERVLALDAELDARDTEAAPAAVDHRRHQSADDTPTPTDGSAENVAALHAEIERLQHELRHRATLFGDICAAIPSVSLGQTEGIEAQTARVVQHIVKLRAYVERVEPLTLTIADFNRQIEERIVQGARASGFELPNRFGEKVRDLTLSPLMSSSQTSIAQIAAYFALSGLEQEITDELQRIYDTLRPQRNGGE